jgi:tRNA-dihydrouridine synthase B
MSKLPKFTSKAFLAPMAGVSDPALRLVCKEQGAGLVVTEFVSIHAIEAKSDDITKFIEFSPKERPLSVQLFGSDLDKIEKAIKIVEPYFDIIDFNMGCPAPHVTQQMACSALLQEPELTRKIFRTMTNATKKPITVKIRAGVDKPDKFLEIAKIAQDEGLAMITLHPRTVKQGYAGKSDWSLIKKLKESVNIPVCGNGDIETPEDAKRMLDETGCDYVMIGRAAAKNPFLFKQVNDYLNTGKYRKVSSKGIIKTFFQYLEYSQKYPTIKFANIRMQAMNFTKGCKGSKKIRGDLIKVKSIDEIKQLLQTLYDNL